MVSFEAVRRRCWLWFRQRTLRLLSRLRGGIEARCDLCGRNYRCGGCVSFAAAVARDRDQWRPRFYIDERGIAYTSSGRPSRWGAPDPFGAPATDRILPGDVPNGEIIFDLREPIADGIRAPLEGIIWKDDVVRTRAQLGELRISAEI